MQILLDEDDASDEADEEPNPYGLYELLGLYDDETLTPIFFAFFVAVSKIRCIIL